MQLPFRSNTPWQFTPAQVLVLGFLTLIVLGTFLLMLPAAHESGEPFGIIDALFMATSAVCVTGLAVITPATQFSFFGESVILGLIQAGGLGIMTTSVLMFLVMGKRISLKERLLMQEALGSFSIAGVVRLTRNIIFVTFLIEAVGAALLFARWIVDHPWQEALWYSVFHSISAFNNAGFDLTTLSMMPYNRDPYILAVIASLFVLGGLGFVVLEEFYRHRRWEKLSLHSRVALKVTGFLIIASWIVFALLEWNNPLTLGEMPWYHKLTNSLFTALTPRTAGFNSIDTGKMMDASWLVMIVLMFIGASPGGTGGGIKTTTLSMIALTIKATATGKEEIQVMGRRLPRELVDKAVTVAAIAVSLIVLMTGILLVTEAKGLDDPENPLTMAKILFESVSAFGTVGLSTGITGDLSPLGRLMITITMFVGRVGPLTMAMALMQRKYNRSPIHYPEDRVMIG